MISYVYVSFEFHRSYSQLNKYLLNSHYFLKAGACFFCVFRTECDLCFLDDFFLKVSACFYYFYYLKAALVCL